MSFELFRLAALSFQIAHSHIAVKFSESETSPLPFPFAEKSNWKFILTSSQLHLLQRYSNKIFTNLSSLFLKNFSDPACQLLTTLILKHISMRFVKSFLQTRCACFMRLEKLKSCFHIPLDYPTRSRRQGQRDKTYSNWFFVRLT